MARDSGLRWLGDRLASEGGAITWVAMHRMHHTWSDRPGKDLHTPKDGFWWSHMGWIVCDLGTNRREIERKYAPELVADPVHRVLNRLHVFPNIIVGLALYAWGGWSYAAWGSLLRIVVTLHVTWLVNSAAHTWGYRTFDTPDGSRSTGGSDSVRNSRRQRVRRTRYAPGVLGA